MKSYLVGGAVRDTLLGLEVKDRDWVVVGATPEQMLSKGYQPVGNDFPVFLHPKTKEEYALARTEQKSGKGYNGFECISNPSITLEQDLLRRDLTINAMAMDDKGRIIDPYLGQKDINDKLLRHVSAAFAEDPLRVLRIARFAARFADLGFTIASQTMSLMKDMVSEGELDHLVAERVWKETSRALMEASPQVYFEVLRECGALKVWFPELDQLWGVPNPPKWHPEIDTGVHTMMVLHQVSLLSHQLPVRYAALVHDVGKGLTDPQCWPSHKGHEKKGLSLIDAMGSRLKAPVECTTLGKLVCEYHSHIHRAFELKPSTLVAMFNRCDVWRRPERFSQLLIACTADARGRTGFEDDAYPQADYIRAAYLAAHKIDVQEIIKQGYKGVKIKEQLDQARINTISQVKAKYKVDD